MTIRFGECWKKCLELTREIATDEQVPVTYIRDIFGLSSFAFACDNDDICARIEERVDRLKQDAPDFFAVPHLRFLKPGDGLTKLIEQCRVPLDNDPNVQAFLVDRLLSNSSWKQLSAAPAPELPPVVNFYSFKGGVGRSTCAALSALLMAREGKKVFLLDLDLEAPGIEDFFFTRDQIRGQGLSGGIVDYLLEHKLTGSRHRPNISDFVVSYVDAQISNSGGFLMIVPAGILDKTYIDLLGRVNFPALARTQDQDNKNGLIAMLTELQAWNPADCFITDCRTGFTDLGGLTLNGLSTLDVLIFKAGERDRRFLPLVLELMQRLHQPGVEPEALAQRFLILFNMVEMPAKRSDQITFENELRDFVKTACYENVFKNFPDYVYPDDLAEDSPLEAVPHDYLMIEYLSDFNRAVLADDLDRIQARQINSPYHKLVRRIIDVKLHRIFMPQPNPEAVTNTTHSGISSGPVGQLRAKAVTAMRAVVASGSGEDDFSDEESFREKFLIRNVYRTMLELRSFIILGRKGAGKSALFQLLQQQAYLKYLATHLKWDLAHLLITSWAIGFNRGKDFPSVGKLALLKDQSQDGLVSFWRTFAAYRLIQNETFAHFTLREQLTDVVACLRLYADDLFQATVERFFDDLEVHLEGKQEYTCLSYDDLDVGISRDSSVRSKWISALVTFWQGMQGRYKRIKAKIFLREDLWNHEVETTDKSKIRDNIDRVTISWTELDLYRLLVKRFGQLEPIQAYWKGVGIWEADWDEMIGQPLGFIPPENEEKIRQMIESLTGEAMAGGQYGHKKGYAYTWILKHLADAVGVIRPRQMLLLFSKAAMAQGTPRDSGGLLETRSIRTALKTDVSNASVADLKEEYRVDWSVDDTWIPDTFSGFERIWPVEEDRLLEHLAKHTNTPGVMISRMVEAGLLRRSTTRNKKSVQVPDIYLYGLGLTRHG